MWISGRFWGAGRAHGSGGRSVGRLVGVQLRPDCLGRSMARYAQHARVRARDSQGAAGKAKTAKTACPGWAVAGQQPGGGGAAGQERPNRGNKRQPRRRTTFQSRFDAVNRSTRYLREREREREEKGGGGSGV